MPYIDIIHESSATGELKTIYDSLIEQRGKVANIMKIQSLNPATIQTHMALYLSIMFRKSELSRAEREMVAVVVSAVNGCHYCVNHHAEALNHYWKDTERTAQLATDYNELHLSQRERAMLTYATKLTVAPGDMSDVDTASLRTAGLSDSAILDLTLVISYFNFVNRIAMGLGVEFSEEEVTGYKY